MNDAPLRRKILIAGALTGNLSEDERQELDQMRAADPTIDAEFHKLREVVERLETANVTWREGNVPAGLEDRILSKIADVERNRRDAEDQA